MGKVGAIKAWHAPPRESSDSRERAALMLRCLRVLLCLGGSVRADRAVEGFVVCREAGGALSSVGKEDVIALVSRAEGEGELHPPAPVHPLLDLGLHRGVSVQDVKGGKRWDGKGGWGKMFHVGPKRR